MAKLRGLHLRGKTYYSRVIVPTALVSQFGRRQIWKSLGTSIRSEAEALHLQEAAVWSAAFAEAEHPYKTSAPPLSRNQRLGNAEVAALARKFFSRARTSMELNALGPADVDLAQRENAAADLEWQLSALQSWANPDAHQLVDEAKRLALGPLGPAVPATDASGELLSELLRRALVQLGSLRLARLRGDYRDAIDDNFFRNPAGAVAADTLATSAGTTLGDSLDRYQVEVLDFRLVTAKTRLKHRALLTHIGEHFGRRTPLGEISRSDCNRFRDVLAKLPPNFGKGAKQRSISAVTDGEQSIQTLAWETQNTYLKMLSNLMAWAVQERLVSTNVAERIAPLKIRQVAEAQRLPFSTVELQSIFSAPIFTGCIDDKRRFSKPGPNVVKGSRYWLPLIGLFTGMRMGEILQLTPGHVRRSPTGNPFFVLTRDMRLKTGSAEREVPIHPELVELGFLEWVEEHRGSGAGQLFDDVPESKHGYRSDIFTKRFASFLRSTDLPSDRRPKLCYHSFRHTFKDALNETGASEEVKDEICGWSRSKRTGRRYGTGLSADQLQPHMQRVSFDLDLSHLKV